MRAVRFTDGRPMRLLVYGRSIHLFVYRYGITVRWRNGSDWQHLALRATHERLYAPKASRLCLFAETWRTADGTYLRVTHSKKYVSLRVLA